MHCINTLLRETYFYIVNRKIVILFHYIIIFIHNMYLLRYLHFHYQKIENYLLYIFISPL